MKIIDMNTNREVFNPDLTIGELSAPTMWASPEKYATIDNVTKFALADDDYEEVQLYHAYTPEEIAQREEAEREAAKQERREAMFAKLDQCFTEELVPSDKEGFLWKVVRLGEVEIMREYVTDPDYDPDGEDGSYLKPYKYTSGMEVIESMWYYDTDKDLPHECIKSGIPTSFEDTEFFDIVA